MYSPMQFGARVHELQYYKFNQNWLLPCYRGAQAALTLFKKAGMWAKAASDNVV